MTYRGFSPRTRLLRWGLVSIVIGLALGASLPSAATALVNLLDVAPDRLPWVATRLIGFLSYFAIAGSVIYGLLLSTRILDALAHRPVTYALHQDMAAIGLGLAGIHAVLLGLDASVPFSFTQMLVPFAAPYRPVWVGVGQVALYITIVVTASFYLRRRIGQRTWRLIHYLTFLSFLGATVHGILSGTDTPTTWAWWSYTLPTVAVVFLLTYRIIDAALVRGERGVAAGAPGARLPAGGGQGRPDRAGGPAIVPPQGPLERRMPVRR